MDLTKKRICIVGTGFVGLTLGLAFAKRGFNITFVDSNVNVIQKLNQAQSHVKEPNINELIAKLLEKKSILFQHSESFRDLNQEFDNFIISVGTPVISGIPDTSALESATSLISQRIRNGNLIVQRSTVSIGTSRKIVFDRLKEFAPKAFFATCPERTAEGVALTEIFEIPQIVGGLDAEDAEKAKSLFSQICKQTIIVSSPEAAELSKLASNTYRDLVFGFSNDLARISHAYNINQHEVLTACNTNYPRANIPKPGPVGGPCLSKDSWILHHSAVDKKVETYTPSAARKSNENIVIEFVGEIFELYKELAPEKISLLGLSFKGNPAVADFRGSPAEEVIPYLASKFPKAKLFGYENSGPLNLEAIKESKSLKEVLKDSDLVLLLTNNKSFVSIEDEINHLVQKNSVIIDFWSSQNKGKLRNEIRYHQWGNL